MYKKMADMRHIQERKLQTFLIRKLLLHSLSSAYFTHTHTTHGHWQILITLISIIQPLSSPYFTHTRTIHIQRIMYFTSLILFQLISVSHCHQRSLNSPISDYFTHTCQHNSPILISINTVIRSPPLAYLLDPHCISIFPSQ